MQSGRRWCKTTEAWTAMPRFADWRSWENPICQREGYDTAHAYKRGTVCHFFAYLCWKFLRFSISKNEQNASFQNVVRFDVCPIFHKVKIILWYVQIWVSKRKITQLCIMRWIKLPILLTLLRGFINFREEGLKLKECSNYALCIELTDCIFIQPNCIIVPNTVPKENF